VEKHKETLKIVLICFFSVALISLVLGYLSLAVGGAITIRRDVWEALYPRLQLMFIVAVLIERSTEVYLNATDKNGPDRFNLDQRTETGTSAAKPASTVAIGLGLVVSLAGVRILSDVPSAALQGLQAWLWTGADVIISAGLLAGGATLIHEIAELLRGGLNQSSNLLRKNGKLSSANNGKNIAEYEIKVLRQQTNSGTVIFEGNGVRVNSVCWWDPKVKIRAGTYTECSATRMNSKTDSVTGLKRPAIFLPTAVAPDTGNNTIFIHEGKDANWSDGCIVLAREDFMQIWNVIEKDKKNVVVQVDDQ